MIPPFPKIRSSEGLALMLMLNGERLTHLGFFKLAETYCLRTSILDLRQSDWPVDDVFQSGAKNIFSGRRKKFKNYFLNPEQLTEFLREDRTALFLRAGTWRPQRRYWTGIPKAQTYGYTGKYCYFWHACRIEA